jgi:hypothetical protein
MAKATQSKLLKEITNNIDADKEPTQTILDPLTVNVTKRSTSTLEFDNSLYAKIDGKGNLIIPPELISR